MRSGGGGGSSPESLQVSSLKIFIEFWSEGEVGSEELHSTTRQKLVTSLHYNLASTGAEYIYCIDILSYCHIVIYHLSLAVTDKS